jgi:hypothetical protein
MNIESILSLTSAGVGLVGFIAVIRAYRQTIKTADPDMDRVHRFVKSAPTHKLKNIKLSKVTATLVPAKAE